MPRKGNYPIGRNQRRILAAMVPCVVYTPSTKAERHALEGRNRSYAGLIGRGIVKRKGSGFILVDGKVLLGD